MSNFLYDNTDLDFPKTDLEPLPEGADPTEYCMAANWNKAMQALLDVRGAILSGKYFGFTPGADPALSGHTYIFSQSNQLKFHKSDNTVVSLGVPVDPAGYLIVSKYATGGDGSGGDPWTGWDTFLNGYGSAYDAFFPPGYYMLTTGLVVPVGSTLIGSGSALSQVFTFSGYVGGILRVAGTQNFVSDGDVLIADLALENGNSDESNASCVGVEISYLSHCCVARCKFTGWWTGLAIDQGQNIEVVDSEFDISNPWANNPRGIWLVNGPDLNVGSNPGLTSDINLNNCFFSGTEGPGNGYQLVDDGGTLHNTRGCKFYGGEVGIYVTAGSVINIEDNHFENLYTRHVVMANVTLDASTPIAGSSVLLRGNIFNGDSNAAVSVLAGSNTLVSDGNMYVGDHVTDSGHAIIGGAHLLTLLSSEDIITTGDLIDVPASVRSIVHGTWGVGINTTTSNSGLDIGAAWNVRPLAIALSSGGGTFNNVAVYGTDNKMVGAASVVGPESNFSITGLARAGGSNMPFSRGQRLRVFNDTGFNMTLPHMSGSSSVGNKIRIFSGTGLVIGPGGWVDLVYDFDDAQSHSDELPAWVATLWSNELMFPSGVDNVFFDRILVNDRGLVTNALVVERTIQSLSVVANVVAWDGSYESGLKAVVTLTDNATISAMTSAIPGENYQLAIIGASGHTLDWDATYDFGSATPPTAPVAGEVLVVNMDCTSGDITPHLRCTVFGGGFSS